MDVLSRRRRAAVWVLIVVASLIGLASILTTWVNRQMLDNDAWSKASADLIEDPQVREGVSVYLVDQLYTNVDVGAGLQERLPGNLKPLAPTIAGALREPATQAVDRLLSGPRVQRLWIAASTAAQERLVNVLENKTGLGISTGDGVVMLDLSELATEIGNQLGLPDALLARIPPGTAQLEIMRSDQLSAAQAGVRAVKVLSTWLLVLVLALFALALYLARGARRVVLRNIGFAFIVVGLIVLVVRRAAGNAVVDALTDPTSRDSGWATWLIGTSILGQIAWASILYGAIMVAGAVLAGAHKWAVAARNWLAPVLNDRPAVAWSVVAAAYLILIAWGPTHALRTLWGILLLGGLIAAGVVALRHETLAERAAPAGAG
jgi:hypothetical protein